MAAMTSGENQQFYRVIVDLVSANHQQNAFRNMINRCWHGTVLNSTFNYVAQMALLNK